MTGADLGQHRIAVSWMTTDDADPDLWPCLAAGLDATEQARMVTFRNLRDAQSYIAAHAMVRWMLAGCLGEAPSSIRFRQGLNGRPEVALQPAGLPLSFSLSHTVGLVIAVTAFGHEVGVDAENMAAARFDLAAMGDVFAPPEIDLLGRRRDAARLAAAFELWTLKEAYLKATGHGLTCKPESFAFELAPPRLRIAAAHDTDPGAWQFLTWCLTARHVAALAVRPITGTSATIDVRRLQPIELTAARPWH